MEYSKKTSYKGCGIYIIENMRNRKKYIGSSNCIQKRWRNHLSQLRRNIHKNNHLQNSWNKYGEEHFNFSIKEEVRDSGILLEREQYYMDTFSSYDPIKGYNFLEKAERGCSISKDDDDRILEYSKKVSKSKKGYKVPISQIKKSIETRKKMGSGNKPILQFTLENVFLKKWNSDTDIKKELGYNLSCISMCCTGKRNKSYGFKWSFENNFDK